MRLSWDIFCTVIDNFGDIGVCWRLARQLAQERGEPVRLWVDDLAALGMLQTQLDINAATQMRDGVEIRHWTTPFPTVQPYQVVIEAFACNPPNELLTAMVATNPKPVWINLDYLSAETWVEGCHALGSRHPRLPLTHHFFFPGFTAATGGLLREANLLSERDTFQTQGTVRTSWLAKLGLSAAEQTRPLVSLFCYDNPALPGLLHHWASGAPLCLLVTHGKASRQVEAWLGEPFLPGNRLQRSQLTLFALPFLSQPDYDRLLWACDFNFIRGEDSFVRAQWAARPMAWHIYPQEEEAHLPKLDAFLVRYLESLPDAQRSTLTAFWHSWNQYDTIDTVAHWQVLWSQRDELATHSQRWCKALAQQASLMQQLADFATAKFDPSG
ncbi:elongation factor P maturation arginine rhamnosyltransferase EarP [Chitinimonas sp. BJB300]|uniref:elongation factor P maturation arginine rhamnosyltransferase EarP n=1 Tax=Chitinimonas sp. BJB300 TaxID=1559339 RepID=UPI000C102141|nr:elongation factor P maturation arginine rhamnosyltransferase EarP [Chitinimonas sp. BJB300]PHV11960.1 elongation factor P maturation arginine rhamnosyltransferase EarP [Chitinimonas sp. BJB300]TSJ87276.1 elongation factor P maturation arginine rhamnosyltransferase EarP [Chitinimonas sp. BJB300]